MIVENEYFENVTRRELVKITKLDEKTLTYKVIYSDAYNPKTEFVNTIVRFNNIYVKINNPTQW